MLLIKTREYESTFELKGFLGLVAMYVDALRQLLNF